MNTVGAVEGKASLFDFYVGTKFHLLFQRSLLISIYAIEPVCIFIVFFCIKLQILIYQHLILRFFWESGIVCSV
jgi:hypothetical protein